MPGNCRCGAGEDAFDQKQLAAMFAFVFADGAVIRDGGPAVIARLPPRGVFQQCIEPRLLEGRFDGGRRVQHRLLRVGQRRDGQQSHAGGHGGGGDQIGGLTVEQPRSSRANG